MTIGIYGISSQSGKAFLADYLAKGYDVIGYPRATEHGLAVISCINEGNGLYLERPANKNNETTRFVSLTPNSQVTSDLQPLVEKSDIIIIALPSICQEETVKQMCEAGVWKRRVPIVLSPSRTIATPYLWKILGERYPVVCFSTCPYSCKAPKLDTSLIKRRKRTWVASLEGDFTNEQRNMLKKLFPQAALTKIPSLTSLNNIGAVFHCATYLLNIEEIERRKAAGEVFSFYMDGIAARPEVGAILEEIDQTRLQIASALGIEVFGLKEKPREDIWRKLTNGLRALEDEHEGEIEVLRSIRKQFMQYLNNCVLSAPHWLDITYGVVRDENETLSQAIGRTPTYQKNSVPQLRYLTEDIPTGLVPIEALAKMLGIKHGAVTNIIDGYNKLIGEDIRGKGRNLKEFDLQFIKKYLNGDY